LSSCREKAQHQALDLNLQVGALLCCTPKHYINVFLVVVW
jgi:hypothetical protein